jgi:hypothetical protein
MEARQQRHDLQHERNACRVKVLFGSPRRLAFGGQWRLIAQDHLDNLFVL